MSSGEDITHKVAKIKNFTIFMDYNTGFTNHSSDEPQKGIVMLG